MCVSHIKEWWQKNFFLFVRITDELVHEVLTCQQF